MNRTNLKVLAIATVMLLFGNGAYLNAQVTVGDNTPPAATLDVVYDGSSTTPAGVIAPRVDRQYLNDNNGNYSTDQKGAIVYVENVSNGSATLKAVNVTKIGYYYFDGALWQAFGGGGLTTNVIKKLSTSPYVVPVTDLTADRTFIISYGSGSPSLIKLPDLTAGDVGKEVHIHNSNTGNGVPVERRELDNGISNGTTTYSKTHNSAVMFTLGLIWSGEFWIPLER